MALVTARALEALTLPEVLQKIHALPSLPAVVLELLSSLDQENVNLDTLARKISLDQALTAKTLRLANSSFYGMQRQVTTIGEAIAVLGIQTVRNLATTAALIGSFPGDTSNAFDFITFWRHAIGTALCARSLAAQLGLNPEQAYIAGLLHDIGRLVLATQFTSHYAAMAGPDGVNTADITQAERAVLGLDHAMVGEALARHWKFPDLIQQAIAQHHAPEAQHTHDIPALARVIHVANALAHALDVPTGQDSALPHLPHLPRFEVTTREHLGLNEAMLLTVFQEAQSQLEGACSVLAQ